MRIATMLYWMLHTALLAPAVGASMQTTADKSDIATSPPRLLPYVVLRGHTDGIQNANFSPDGSRIVTTSKDGTARLWDIDGKPLAVLGGHTGFAHGGRFSPDGSRILTWSREDSARLWDGAGKEVAVLAGAVYLGRFSPTGDRVATTSYSFAGDLSARVWDRDGNEVAVLEGHTDWVVEVTFNSDGSRILTTSNDGTARLWSADGEPIAVLHHTADRNDERHAVWHAEFSSSGNRIITYSFDYTVRLWDTDGMPIAVLPGPSRWPFGGSPYTPDGSRFVSAQYDDGTAHLYDSDWKEIVELVGHTGPVLAAGFSPDGSRILTFSHDRTARLWDRQGKPVAVLIGHTGSPYGMFSPDGSRVLTNSDDPNDRVARLWDSNGKPLALLDGSGQFSPDGGRILAIHGDTASILHVPAATTDVPE